MAVPQMKHSTIMTLNLAVAIAVVLLSAYVIVGGLSEGAIRAFLPLAGIVVFQALLVVVTTWRTIKALRLDPVHASSHVLGLNIVVLALGFAQGVDFFAKSQINIGELASLIVAALAFLNIVCLLAISKSAVGAR